MKLSNNTLMAIFCVALFADAAYIQYTQNRIQAGERKLASLEEEVSQMKIELGDPTTVPPNRYFTVEKVLDEDHFVAFVGGDIYSDGYKFFKLPRHGFVEKKSYAPSPGGSSVLVPHFKQMN